MLSDSTRDCDFGGGQNQSYKAQGRRLNAYIWANMFNCTRTFDFIPKLSSKIGTFTSYLVFMNWNLSDIVYSYERCVSNTTTFPCLPIVAKGDTSRRHVARRSEQIGGAWKARNTVRTRCRKVGATEVRPRQPYAKWKTDWIEEYSTKEKSNSQLFVWTLV